jgi:hypothetical protein
MTFRTAVAALVVGLLSAGPASAADVPPKPGVILGGTIDFPREQRMSIETDPRDGTTLTVRMGFDGRCRGGGIQEAWVSALETTPTVRARNGRFAASLTGIERDFGHVRGRTATFTWKLSGRFTAAAAVTATVSGSAVIKHGRKVISRCEIAERTRVRLVAP